LAIDYGVEEVVTDTLQALKAHTKVSALETPGAADLTSHVDFGDLARRLGAGRRVFGPTTQGQFLRKLGLDMRTATLVRANPMRADALMAAAARLADPDQMGSLFKVLALCDSPWPDPVGFA
jgi:SAM-dependent MidA family methyltransferase